MINIFYQRQNQTTLLKSNVRIPGYFPGVPIWIGKIS